MTADKANGVRERGEREGTFRTRTQPLLRLLNMFGVHFKVGITPFGARIRWMNGSLRNFILWFNKFCAHLLQLCRANGHNQHTNNHQTWHQLLQAYEKRVGN